MGDMADDEQWAEEIAAGALSAPPGEDEPQCELWDLPVSMCGCPTHRGGQTPEEEAAEYGMRPSPWWTAQHHGWCERGDHAIRPGDQARFDGGRDGGLECQACLTSGENPRRLES
jgi:hypothetical protein